jgi:hypothetical protein
MSSRSNDQGSIEMQEPRSRVVGVATTRGQRVSATCFPLPDVQLYVISYRGHFRTQRHGLRERKQGRRRRLLQASHGFPRALLVNPAVRPGLGHLQDRVLLPLLRPRHLPLPLIPQLPHRRPRTLTQRPHRLGAGLASRALFVVCPLKIPIVMINCQRICKVHK